MQYRSVTVLAPAKLNLSLDVVGTLPNGYHDLDMVMQTIDLYEKITLRRSNDLSLTLPHWTGSAWTWAWWKPPRPAKCRRSSTSATSALLRPRSMH